MPAYRTVVGTAPLSSARASQCVTCQWLHSQEGGGRAHDCAPSKALPSSTCILLDAHLTVLPEPRAVRTSWATGLQLLFPHPSRECQDLRTQQGHVTRGAQGRCSLPAGTWPNTWRAMLNKSRHTPDWNPPRMSTCPPTVARRTRLQRTGGSLGAVRGPAPVIAHPHSQPTPAQSAPTCTVSPHPYSQPSPIQSAPTCIVGYHLHSPNRVP